MSLTPAADDAETGSEDDSVDDPEIPVGVLRGIEDIATGDTASKADLESVLDS